MAEDATLQSRAAAYLLALAGFCICAQLSAAGSDLKAENMNLPASCVSALAYSQPLASETEGEDEAGSRAEGPVVWAGCEDKGAYRYSNGLWSRLDIPGPEPDSCLTILVEERRYVWFGMARGGLCRLNTETGKWRRFTPKEGFPSNHIYCSMRAGTPTGEKESGAEGKKAPRQRLWFGTAGGIAVWDGQEFETYTRAEGLPSNQVVSLARSGNRIVAATAHHGIARFQNGRFKRMNLDLPRRINRIFFGPDRSLWVCTADGLGEVTPSGVKIHDKTFRSLKLSDNYFTSGARTDGRLYFGLRQGGMLEVGEARARSHRDLLGETYIKCLQPGPGAALYVGTYGGGLWKVVRN